MGLFSRNNKDIEADFSAKGMTAISKGSAIVGDITNECNLHIDGIITGNIISNAIVTVGTSGRVNGKIRAYKIIVSGICKGELEADIVEILTNSKVVGDITSSKLILERDSYFEGRNQKKQLNEYIEMK
ncbi:polymer-forming cytoskeletal protein [Fusobacterium sp.]|uniref:bactofilin family protein n=1 Tax=Fusobacterium sp. TaxID=68766 RepID=UPI002903A339|nr:polymer-forming cytoskeletal protein [Fusobacterium sp.]MDU1912413.1 polymer-forming cytoskeletal protein [Fusobacterium sp.]